MPLKKFKQRKTTCSLLLRTMAVVVVTVCVMSAREVPLCLLIPGASGFEMFPP